MLTATNKTQQFLGLRPWSFQSSGALVVPAWMASATASENGWVRPPFGSSAEIEKHPISWDRTRKKTWALPSGTHTKNHTKNHGKSLFEEVNQPTKWSMFIHVPYVSSLEGKSIQLEIALPSRVNFWFRLSVKPSQVGVLPGCRLKNNLSSMTSDDAVAFEYFDTSCIIPYTVLHLVIENWVLNMIDIYIYR